MILASAAGQLFVGGAACHHRISQQKNPGTCLDGFVTTKNISGRGHMSPEGQHHSCWRGPAHTVQCFPGFPQDGFTVLDWALLVLPEWTSFQGGGHPGSEGSHTLFNALRCLWKCFLLLEQGPDFPPALGPPHYCWSCLTSGSRLCVPCVTGKGPSLGPSPQIRWHANHLAGLSSKAA